MGGNGVFVACNMYNKTQPLLESVQLGRRVLLNFGAKLWPMWVSFGLPTCIAVC